MLFFRIGLPACLHACLPARERLPNHVHNTTVLKEGNGVSPAKGVSVSAHYTGKLASNGETFDSSVTRGTPFTFPVGGGRVIKVGWRV